VVPWAAARCVQRWSGDRGQRALARWRSVAREAGKQSRRTWLPAVAELASTAAVTARLPAADLGVVLHPNAAAPLAAAAVPATGTVVIVVGPEGGLDVAELDAFAAADATAYRLGPTVLRTSTAGVVAVATLLARSPRWTRRA
jgi:16S rRNA (uracil1498-N3)-methyltransferase